MFQLTVPALDRELNKDQAPWFQHSWLFCLPEFITRSIFTGFSTTRPENVRKESGIFARRAMVDQAREGLCYQ